jgi:hypothetical protein
MPIAVRGRVVHRALMGDRVRYGIALEEGEGPAAEDTHDVLLQYVLRRQRELVEDGVGHETLLRMLGSTTA